MDGFGLLVGHLFGDFLLQTDWMAKSKTSDSRVCVAHCASYTLGVCLFALWLPIWAMAVIFATHFAIDRWRLARVFMKWTDHEEFATGGLSPWSIIVTDQVLHLIILYVIGIVVRGMP